MFFGIHLPLLALLMAAGVLLDGLLGELPRWHPLVGFGRMASVLERRLNVGSHRLLRGACAWSLAVLPLVASAALACFFAGSWISAVLHALLLYFCLGLRSLRDHMMPIGQALQRGDLVHARELTSRIVSRDTGEASASDLAKAAVESMLENGNDAVFGTLFWFLVAGGPGALLFRLVNTLDAMWGYRTPRFRSFGCPAARIDDALNWIPARLTALSYALLGNARLAWSCWRTQAPQWSSPNAGPVMASGAGSLGLALGGEATYHGIVESRPPLGLGRMAEPADIGRAWRLVKHGTALWLLAAGTAGLIVFLKGY
jgi:adenosylcobinamide-phosphate synthase